MAVGGLATGLYFRMKYILDGEERTLILDDEPIKWDAVNIILKRDPHYFGMNYQFTDGEVQLEFDKYSGVDIIDSVYKKYRQDGVIILQYLTVLNGIETIEYEGKLNLNFYKKVDGIISCTLENAGFHELINSREDTKIDLFSNLTLDSIDMVGNDSVDTELHSKGIKKIFKCNNGEEGAGTLVDGIGLPVNFFFTFNTSTETSQINEYFGTINSTWEDAPYIGENKLPVWKIKESGRYKFKLQAKFKILGQLQFNGCFGIDGSLESLKCELFIRRESKDNELISEINIYTKNSIPTGNSFSNPGSIGIDEVDYEGEELELSGEDIIYVYGKLSFTTLGCRGSITRGLWTTYFKMDVLSITQLQSSVTKSFMIYEAFNKLLHSVTGQSNALESEYLGKQDNGYSVDGPGSKFIITNGFLIRNFIQNGSPLRSLSISIKEMISSLKAIFALGIGYEWQGSKQVVRVEPFEYFFQDREILRIEDCSDYTEETATEFIYNEAEVGYSKYPDEGEYILDEFNTEQTYLTPIKSNKNTYSAKSDLIASGYALELTRRYQFEEKQQDSTTYDDNNFIISVVENGGSWKSEKNENFDTSNIFDPGTAYNLRITPKRNLFRSAKLLNSCLDLKNSSELIKCTSYKNNGDATTRELTSDKIIVEKSNLPLYSFGDREKLFSPIWVSFKCRLSMAEIMTIRNACTGRDENKKNGYITVRDDNGEYVKFYSFEITFNPSKEEVTFKGLRSGVISTFIECDEYADWSFAMFESTPDLPASIEDCTFANFN